MDLGTSYGDDYDEETSQYEIKDSEAINSEMKRVISDTSEFTCLPEGDVILLLIYFKWNTSKMNDVYFDDIDNYLAKAGTGFNESEPPEEIDCDICFDTVKNPISLSCGHYFCRKCWKDYIEEKFNTGVYLDIKCMQPGCHHIVTQDLIKSVSTYFSDRYWYFLKKNYIESQGNVFCPNPHCGRAIIIKTSDRRGDNISCSCGQRFCFKCLREFHSPASCQNMNDWDNLGTQDDYLLLTVKNCIHCGCPCERTHGCNHMTCPKCKGEWCWMCRGDWKTHGSHTGGFYSCNIYNAGNSKGNELDRKAQDRKAFHEKYMHYYERYQDHGSLLRQTRDKKAQVEHEIRKVFEKTPRVIERLFESFDTLILARNWLKCSYIYSYYYSEKGNVSELFNHQQAQIEHFTEILGGLLFKPVATYDPEDIATKAGSLRKVIDNFSTMN